MTDYECNILELVESSNYYANDDDDNNDDGC